VPAEATAAPASLRHSAVAPGALESRHQAEKIPQQQAHTQQDTEIQSIHMHFGSAWNCRRREHHQGLDAGPLEKRTTKPPATQNNALGEQN